LAEFIMEGHFGHHVRRMRQVYSRRNLALCEAAGETLAGKLDVTQAESGMRCIAWIRNGQKDRDAARRARALGLEVAALSEFTIRHPHPDALILGFAGSAPAELKRGAAVLSESLDSVD
jgi:GntR family transcriptional regulator/MocR family aminotransferase